MTFFTQVAAMDVNGVRATARVFSLEILGLKRGVAGAFASSPGSLAGHGGRDPH